MLIFVTYRKYTPVTFHIFHREKCVDVALYKVQKDNKLYNV